MYALFEMGIKYTKEYTVFWLTKTAGTNALTYQLFLELVYSQWSCIAIEDKY